MFYLFIRSLQKIAALNEQSDSEFAAQHDELSVLASNSVRFRAKSEPTAAVTSAAAAMRDYATMHALVGSSLFAPLDIAALRAHLALLNPHNMLLVVIAQPPHPGWQPFAADSPITSAIEPNYGFAYTTAPFHAAQLMYWGARHDGRPCENGWRAYSVDLPLHKELTVLPANAFIPTDFDIKCKNEAASLPDDRIDVSISQFVLDAHPCDAPLLRITDSGETSRDVLPKHVFSGVFPEPLRVELPEDLARTRLATWWRQDTRFLLPKSTLLVQLEIVKTWFVASDPRCRMLQAIKLAMVEDLLQVRCRGSAFY